MILRGMKFCGIRDILYSGAKVAGNHKIIWNGLDQWNRDVGSGTYIIRLVVGASILTQKAVLIR